ncbi:MAG: hypothetical protein HC896_11885 [Bacteroidales bacterium]|nr:hypothetical protein [Bacteroidales bacterium]
MNINNLALSIQKKCRVQKLTFLLALLVVSARFGLAQNDSIRQQDNGAALKEAKVPLDTVVLSTDNKIFTIVEYDESMTIDRIDLKTGEKKRILDIDCKDCGQDFKDTSKFRGHWSGIEIGLNDFVTSNFSIKRPTGYGYLDLNNFRSWEVNINFARPHCLFIKNMLDW